jgi:hypothetical protein
MGCTRAMKNKGLRMKATGEPIIEKRTVPRIGPPFGRKEVLSMAFYVAECFF